MYSRMGCRMPCGAQERALGFCGQTKHFFTQNYSKVLFNTWAEGSSMKMADRYRPFSSWRKWNCYPRLRRAVQIWFCCTRCMLVLRKFLSLFIKILLALNILDVLTVICSFRNLLSYTPVVRCMAVYIQLGNRCLQRFPSCLSPQFQSKSKCEAFYMEISFIHMHILVHLCVNKTNFHTKGFALGLALKQRRNATQKWAIDIELRYHW